MKNVNRWLKRINAETIDFKNKLTRTRARLSSLLYENATELQFKAAMALTSLYLAWIILALLPVYVSYAHFIEDLVSIYI